MAIHLEFNYGKRLGLPGYSSHNFSVSLKTEVTNAGNIAEEAQRIYGILQQSVDEQIVHKGYIPEQKSFQPTNGTNGNHSRNGTNDNHHNHVNSNQGSGTMSWQCSDKQKNLITDILNRNNLDLPVIDDLAVELHGKQMAQLSKLEASGVVGEIISRYGRRQAANNSNGGQR